MSVRKTLDSAQKYIDVMRRAGRPVPHISITKQQHDELLSRQQEKLRRSMKKNASNTESDIKNEVAKLNVTHLFGVQIKVVE